MCGKYNRRETYRSCSMSSFNAAFSDLVGPDRLVRCTSSRVGSRLADEEDELEARGVDGWEDGSEVDGRAFLAPTGTFSWSSDRLEDMKGRRGKCESGWVSGWWKGERKQAPEREPCAHPEPPSALSSAHSPPLRSARESQLTTTHISYLPLLRWRPLKSPLPSRLSPRSKPSCVRVRPTLPA